MSITHTFVSGIADGADNTLVQPSDWNATHTIADGYSLMRVATVTLNDAQIKNLPTTPFEIVPAPGVGKVATFFAAVLIIDTTAGAYDNIGPAPAYAYIGRSTGARLSDHLYKTLMLQESGSVQYAVLSFGHDNDADPSITVLNSVDGGLSGHENQSITLNAVNVEGNFTAGNAANTLRVTVYYMVLDV